MNSTIEDLKEALGTAYAATSEASSDSKTSVMERASLPALRGYRGDGGPRHSRRVLTAAWISGIAALVLVLALTVPQAIHQNSPRPTGTTTRTSQPAPTGPPALLAVVDGRLELVSKAAGSVLRTVAALGNANFNVITVTADDRTAFVGTDLEAVGLQGGPYPIERVPLDGQKPSVVELDATSPAVSPDGQQLAFFTSAGRIEVRDLRTGTSRTWSFPEVFRPITPENPPTVLHLSWLPDGVHLLVTIAPRAPSAQSAYDTVEVLDTSLPAGNDNPRYLGPGNTQKGASGWSYATALSDGSAAVITEQPVYGPTSKTIPVAHNLDIDKVSLATGRPILWFQPPSAGTSSVGGFQIIGMTFDDSGDAYVVGESLCPVCQGEPVRGPSNEYRIYRVVSGQLQGLPTTAGPTTAVSWLRHSYLTSS